MKIQYCFDVHAKRCSSRSFISSWKNPGKNFFMYGFCCIFCIMSTCVLFCGCIFQQGLICWFLGVSRVIHHFFWNCIQFYPTHPVDNHFFTIVQIPIVWAVKYLFWNIVIHSFIHVLPEIAHNLAKSVFFNISTVRTVDNCKKLRFSQL